MKNFVKTNEKFNVKDTDTEDSDDQEDGDGNDDESNNKTMNDRKKQKLLKKDKKTETIESKCILQLEWLQNSQLLIKYSCTIRAFCQTVEILNLQRLRASF